MANPPITIGPFVDNVPAPGSPIRSDWSQEISQYVFDKGTMIDQTSQRLGYIVGTGYLAGTISFGTPGTWHHVPIGPVNITIAGHYLIRVSTTLVLPGGCECNMRAACDGAIVDATGGGGANVGIPAAAGLQVTDQVPKQFNVGSYTIGLMALPNLASSCRNSNMWVQFIGRPPG